MQFNGIDATVSSAQAGRFEAQPYSQKSCLGSVRRFRLLDLMAIKAENPCSHSHAGGKSVTVEQHLGQRWVSRTHD